MKKRKLNTKKLLTYLGGMIIATYILICCVSYATKTTEKAREYMSKETTIIVK